MYLFKPEAINISDSYFKNFLCSNLDTQNDVFILAEYDAKLHYPTATCSDFFFTFFGLVPLLVELGKIAAFFP